MNLSKKLGRNSVYTLANMAWSYPLDETKWNTITSRFGFTLSPNEFITTIKKEAFIVLDSLSGERIQELGRIMFRLEPENLSCDGERSVEEQQMFANSLLKHWEDLEETFGFILPVEEFEDYYYSRQSNS